MSFRVYGLLSLSWVSLVQQPSVQSARVTPNSTQAFALSPTEIRALTDEDKYVKFFDTDPYWHKGWELVGKSFRDKGETPLKKFCEDAHFRAGFGMTAVQSASMNARSLKFKNEKYSPKKIDVVTYDIKDYGYFADEDVESKRFYITEGLRSDCVFFLTPANVNKTEYFIDQHVCGIILPN